MKRLPRIEIARAYDIGPRDKGYRVLVDRLWPRGVKKETLALDQWAKELAPSSGLRRWFDHRPERWPEFRRRYFQELREYEEEAEKLRAVAARRLLLLIYGAKDETHNNAVALRDYLLAAKRT